MKERSLFANSAWGMISQAVRGVTGLAFIPAVVSNVGLTGYGVYTVALLLSFYQGLLIQMDMGYPSFLINFASRSPDQIHSPPVLSRIQGLMSSLFLINAVIGIACLALPSLLISILKISQEYAHEFALSLGIILVANFFSILTSALSVIWVASHRNAHLKKLETWAYFIFVGLAIALISITPAVHSLAIAFLVSQAVLAVSLFVATHSTFKIVLRPGIPSVSHWKEDWQAWRPFFFSRINGLAQRQSDMTFVTLLLGPQFVAAYDIAMKVPSLVKSLLGKVGEVLGPFASRRRAPEDMPFIKKLSETLVSLQIGFGIFLVFNILFFGKDLCELWLGQENRQVAWPLLIASLINIAIPPASVLMAILMGQGQRSNELAWWPTAISIFNMVATIPVTFYFGIDGTIFLTVIQFALMSVAAVIWAKADFDYRFLGGKVIWVKVAVPSFVVGIAARQILPSVESRGSFILGFIAVEMILGGILYGLLRSDLRNLRSAMVVKASAAVL